MRSFFKEVSAAVLARSRKELPAIAAESDGHLAYFSYKTTPAVRWGWGKPANAFITQRIEAHGEAVRARLLKYAALADVLSSVQRDPHPSAPYWKNQLLPVIDAVSIVGMIEEFRPATFIEIGSGNSTRFACFATARLSPQTRVISIDAYPGNTVAAMPHQMIAKPLEAADLTIFDGLKAGDIVWMDGSHRAFSNTDVAVFFLDVLPRLKPGVIIGVHDICLPWDYPPGWESYFFNELFVMGAYLVGAGDSVEYLFPALYINEINRELRGVLAPIWGLDAVQGLGELNGGGAFWFRRRA